MLTLIEKVIEKIEVAIAQVKVQVKSGDIYTGDTRRYYTQITIGVNHTYGGPNSYTLQVLEANPLIAEYTSSVRMMDAKGEVFWKRRQRCKETDMKKLKHEIYKGHLTKWSMFPEE